jgi:fructokinase
VVFCDRLADDGFGDLLRSCLVSDGVRLGISEPAACPTTLALVDLDLVGRARYRFYLDGTSAPAVDDAVLARALPAGLTALHTGALGLVMEPFASAVDRLLSGGLVGGDVLVMVDPNCRPGAIRDFESYRERLFRILRRADVVKVSVEDLDYLFPGVPAFPEAAHRLASDDRLVLVTDGPRAVHALLPSGEISVDVPAVPIRDTIGAGDAFGGAFLAWWSGRHGSRGAGSRGAGSGGALTRADLRDAGLIKDALRAAVEVAALTCTRPGADPPRLSEVSDWFTAKA